MKAALGWLIVIVLLIGGGGFGLWQFKKETEESKYQIKLAELKRRFLVNVDGLALLEPDRYRAEIGDTLTGYFNELAKLAKEHPESHDIERELKVGEERLKRGHMSESQKLAREERIHIALDLFRRMRDGQYRPLFTDVDKTFRFDVWDISASKVSGEHRIKMSYAHWGAFGPVSYNNILGNMKVEHKKGKPAAIPQFVGEGQPPNLQIKPEEWVAEFPPGLEIGYYDLPQFPRQADAVDLSFDFSIRTIGGSSIPVHIAFNDVPIPESWKVPEGQKWEAQERLASDDELRAAGATIENQAPARMNMGGTEIRGRK